MEHVLDNLSQTLSLFKIIGCLLAVLALAHILYVQLSPWARKLNKFPGPRFVPLFGNFWWYRLLKTQDVFKQTNTPIFGYGTERVWGAWRCVIFTTDLDLVQKVLTSPTSTDKAYELGPAMHTTFTENGLLVVNREGWKPRRKLLLPGLTNTTMNSDFLAVFHTQLDHLMEALEEKWKTGEEFYVGEMFARFLFGAAFENIVGWDESVNFLKDELPGLFKAHRRVTHLSFIPALEVVYSIPIFWWASGYAKEFQKLNKFISRYFSKQYLTRKMAEWKGATSKTDKMRFGEILYSNWSDQEEIFAQLVQILSAAVETTTSVLCTALYLISKHAQVQDKLYQEAVQVIGENGNNVPMNVSDVGRLTYMELVLKEVMRLYPAAPVLGRNMGEEMDLGNGLSIPKDTSVFINVQMIHRNPYLYPDPDRFIPERFFPSAVAKRHAYSFLGFSKGPRNCFGKKHAMMELKFTLAKILYKYELSSGMDEDASKTEMEYTPTPRFKEGLRLRLKLRECK